MALFQEEDTVTADIIRSRGLVAVAAAMLAFGLIAFTGCGDTISMSDPAELDDEATLNEFVDEGGLFDDLGPYEDSAEASGDRSEIDPLDFWRVITDRQREVEILIDQTAGTAEMTVYRDVWGELHIVDEDMVEYIKDFHHEGVRYANFVRDAEWAPPRGGNPSNGGDQANGGDSTNGGSSSNGGNDREGEQHHYRHGPWELTEVSGFLAHSDTVTVSIDWMRIQGDSVDVTVNDPLELMAVPDEIMHFAEGEEITVTVSGPVEGSLLYLHTRRVKTVLQPTGGSEFSATYTAGRTGRYNLWVQAIARETIFDSEYPDDTLVWGVPYVVAIEELDG